MNYVTAPLLLPLLLLVSASLCVGRAGGMAPESGYCIGSDCFTLFRDASSFQSAQSRCGDAGGHLMTVRSSVAHDVLQILLGNATGRFWIGLHLPGGCPDAAAALKGFQWVTKDAESDFTNWPPRFNGSCASSGRCVTVSREDDFTWTRAPCAERAAGFLCENSFGEPCEGLEVGPGETVSYETPLGFTAEDLLFAPPGSVATRRPSEAASICFSRRWLRAPWSCEIKEGGCEYKCAVDPDKSPSCYCPPGRAVNPANGVSCEARDAGDPCASLGCQHVCYKKGDAYACACDHGFQLAADGRSCADFNDCADARQCPGDNFGCVNTPGGFRCVCAAGYKPSAGGDGQCVDVDECSSAPCEHVCSNSPGGYACSCYEGHAVDPASPDKCVLFCGDEECAAVCDPNDPNQCFCPAGYVLDQRAAGNLCVDMDECAYSYCDHSCENTFGGYACACAPGYTLVGVYKCVRNDDEEGDGGSEGSGMRPTPDPRVTPFVPFPGPTRMPSVVSAGGLVGIIVCTVFFVVLLVFVAHLVFTRRRKPERPCA